MFWLNQKDKSNFLILLGIILVSIPAIFQLFKPGFFLSDDGEWMIIRFSAFHQALVDGQFPVRWLGRLNHEYGYPVANFLYPGFMYLAEAPKILGFGFVDSIKIILGLSMVGSAVFTFFWLSKIFSNFAAFVGALFYVYAPYHLFDLYKRGSVGEVLALAIAPFVFWQVERGSLFWGALGIAFIVLSHNTVAILFLPIIALYMALKVLESGEEERISQVYRYTCILVIGLTLSAFFWVPAVFDLQYTRFFQTQVSDWKDYFVGSSLLGVSAIAVFALSAVFILTKKQLSKTVYLFFVIGLFSTFLTLKVSSPLWQLLPVSLIQFPFRFLSVLLLATAILSAFIMNQLRGNVKIVTSIALLALLTFSAAPFGRPAIQFDKGDGYYATNMDTTTVRNEYMPKWVKVMPTERPVKLIELVDGSGEVSTIVATAKEISFTAAMEKEGIIRINKVYFPGWRARVNNREVAISYENDKGVMDISLPAGSHNVSFVFSETSIRFFSDLISLGGFILLIVFSKRRL